MLDSWAPSEPPELSCRKYTNAGAKRRNRMLEYILGYAYFFVVLLAICWHPPWIQVAAIAADDSSMPRKAMFREGATAYDMLGVSKRSSQKDIKRGFRRLAIRLHPDKLGPFKSAEAEREANDVFVKVRLYLLFMYLVPGNPGTCVFRCSRFDENALIG